MAIKRVGNITINYTVPEAQTQLYNAIGRTAGNQAATQQNTNQGGGDNFFTKRGRSIENAIGTTLVTPVALVNEGVENRRIEKDRKDARRSMNDIAKKYGYNSWSDWQDANAAARESGDTEAIKRFNAQLKEFQAQANKNANKATEQANKYNDYRQNDYISKKVNQDNTKFLGSAINTLSTAVDLTGITATPGLNAAQGAIEGFADELEQNGGTIDTPLSNAIYGGGNWSAKNWDNFDWGRAGQNAAIGATTGAVTGALNAGISNSLAKRAAAKGLTNTATKAGIGSTLKNGARTIATGAARGALSGAVGGATGAGLQSAMNGVEFGQGVQNALQGAVQGAQQGAVTGGIMAGANMAISKTPGVGKFYNELQGVKSKWDQSGSNFDERLTNTLTSGDSAVGDWLMNKRQSNLLGAAGSLGNRVQDVSGRSRLRWGDEAEYGDYKLFNDENFKNGYFNGTPSTSRTAEYNEAAKFVTDIVTGKYKGVPDDVLLDKFATLPEGAQNDVMNLGRSSFSDDFMSQLSNTVDPYPNLLHRVNTGEISLSEVPRQYRDQISQDVEYLQNRDSVGAPTTAKGWQSLVDDYDQEIYDLQSELDTAIAEGDVDYQRALEAKIGDAINQQAWAMQNRDNVERPSTPTTAKGWAKKAGQRIVEDINNSNLGNRVRDVRVNESLFTEPGEVTNDTGYSDYNESAKFVNDIVTGKFKNTSDAEILSAFEKMPPNVQQNIIELGEYYFSDNFNKALSNTMDNALTQDSSTYAKSNTRPTSILDNEYYIKNYLKDNPTRTAISSYNKASQFINDIVSGGAKYKTDAEVINGFKQLPADAQQNVLDVGGEWLSDDFMNTLEQNATPTTTKGWVKKAGQRIVEDINNSNLGNRVKDVSPLDDIRMQKAYKDGAWKNLSPLDDIRLQKAMQAKGINNLTPPEDIRLQQALKRNSNQMPEDIRNMQINRNDMLGYEDDNTTPLTVEEVLAREGIGPNSTPRPQATAPAALDPWDRVAQEAGYRNYNEVLQRYAEANPNAEINPRGMAGQVLTWMDQNPNTPTTAAGWAKRAGQRAVEDINNSNLGLRVKDAAMEDPSKRLYNTLVGNQEPVTETGIEADTDMGVVPSKTSKEGKLRYARGKELLMQYGPSDQPMARASEPVKAVQYIADAGFTKPEDVERMANVITGSNGEVSKLTRNLIKSAAPVDTFAGENGQTMEDFIDKRIRLRSLGGRNAGEAVKQTIEANLQSLPSRAEGSVTYTDAPEDVFKVVQNLEASAAELEGRGGSRYFRPTIENIHQAEVLKDAASLLKQRLFDGADVKQALTPEAAQNLKSYDPNNKKYADWVDNTIMKAKSINDLRAAQAPFVRMSRYIDNAYTQAATVGGRMVENANDLSRILTTRNGLLKAGIDTVWNSNAARRGRAAVYDKLADRAADKAANTPDTAAGWAKQAGQRAAEDLGNTNLGNRIQDVSGQPVNPQVATPAELANAVADYNPSTQLYNAIGRTEGALAQETPAQYLANAAQEAEIVSPMEAPTAPTNDIATSMGNAATATYNALTNTPTTAQQATTGSINTGYYQPTGDYWTDVIASAMSAAIDANDVDAFATLFGMYQDQMANLQKQASAAQSSSQQKLTTTQQRANAAMNSLERLSEMEPDTAYNLSSIPLVGNIATLGGNDYEAEAKSLAQQIGYMVSGSNIKDTEAENIGKSYVPQPWDNEQVRQNKLRRAYEIIQRYQNGYAED